MPVQAIFLFPFIHRAAKALLQGREIDLSLGKGFGEQRPQRLDVARNGIGALGIGVASGQLFDLGHVCLIFKGLYVPP